MSVVVSAVGDQCAPNLGLVDGRLGRDTVTSVDSGGYGASGSCLPIPTPVTQGPVDSPVASCQHELLQHRHSNQIKQDIASNHENLRAWCGPGNKNTQANEEVDQSVQRPTVCRYEHRAAEASREPVKEMEDLYLQVKVWGGLS